MSKKLFLAVSLVALLSGLSAAATLGYDSFIYPDGFIQGQSGGGHWNRVNSLVTSWVSEPNNLVSGEALHTVDSSASREYGIGDWTTEMAVKATGVVYCRVTATVLSDQSWFGACHKDFGNVRVIFGMPETGAGLGTFGIDDQDTNGGPATGIFRTTLPAVLNETYVLICAIDYAGKKCRMWVNPDTFDYDRGAADNSADIQIEYKAVSWNTAFQLASGGEVRWDNLIIMTGQESFAQLLGGAAMPQPVDGEKKAPVDTNLSWIGPDNPNLDPSYTIQYAVFADPNQTNVSNGTNCAYSAAMGTSTLYDPAVDMQPDTKYFWRVETQLQYAGKDPNTLKGGIWSFTTAPAHLAPSVKAGPSIVTWAEKAAAGISLNGATVVSNDGDPFTVEWSAEGLVPGADANAVSFSDVTAINPVVTVSSTGKYRLKLKAWDDVFPNPGVDSLVLLIASDACEAAKLNPDGYTRPAGDLNDDCVVNMDDLSDFAATWLKDQNLPDSTPFTAPIPKTNLILWIDASNTDSITLDHGKVVRWNDLSGNGNYLVPGAADHEPLYSATGGPSGMPVVDFGEAMEKTAGLWMQFKKPDGSNYNPYDIRTCFWVLKGGNFMLTDDDSSDFHRNADNWKSPTAPIWQNWWAASPFIRTGKTTWIDGVRIGEEWEGGYGAMTGNYSYISMVATWYVQASRLCGDRNDRTGGQQIAEILIYNTALSDEERVAIENYLKAKWGL